MAVIVPIAVVVIQHISIEIRCIIIIIIVEMAIAMASKMMATPGDNNAGRPLESERSVCHA